MQIKILLAYTKARQASGNHLIDCAVRIGAREDWRVYSKYRYLCLLRPEHTIRKQVQHSLGALAGNEVLPGLMRRELLRQSDNSMRILPTNRMMARYL
jgi:hypothetical protein